MKLSPSFLNLFRPLSHIHSHRVSSSEKKTSLSTIHAQARSIDDITDRQKLPARAMKSPMLLNWLRAHTHEGPLTDRLAASAVAAANTNINTVAIAITIASAGAGTGASTKRYTEEIHQVMKEVERVLGL